MRALLLFCLLLLASCNREAWRIPTAPARPDSAAQPLDFGDGHYKFKGPVTITVQQGQGHSATSTAADNTNAGRRGSAATAPGATSSHTPPAGRPLGFYVVLVLLSATFGFWLRGRIKFPMPF